jgi:hypothetical protein
MAWVRARVGLRLEFRISSPTQRSHSGATQGVATPSVELPCLKAAGGAPHGLGLGFRVRVRATRLDPAGRVDTCQPESYGATGLVGEGTYARADFSAQKTARLGTPSTTTRPHIKH